jgi:alpha-glucosidase
MKIFLTVIFTYFITASSFAYKARPLRLLSPDKKILYEFDIRKGVPGYSVTFQGRKLIDFSIINLVFKDDSIIEGVRLTKSIWLDSSEKYILMTGRSASVEDSFHQISIFLKENKYPARELIVEVRVFDDGIAFRYRFPKSDGDSLIIKKELSAFNIAGNPRVHTLIFGDYHSSHEGFYQHRLYDDLPKDSLMDMPMLFEFSDSIYLAITEAALLNYAGMYLIKTKSGLLSDLSPLPYKPSYAVIAGLPHESPWRVILVSRRPGRFLETNMITDLAPPNRINDWSWIKPGKTTFPWWNGNVTADTLNAPGNNFVTQQYYIDFCSRNNIEYHSVVEYGLHQWYQDDGISFMPGPNSNVLKPVPGLDMKQVCDYARSKGVGVRVWVHWKALYPKLDSAFALFEQWGLSGLMVDFMDRDDQEMVNIQTEILQKAAVHRLHIQFHGAYKPTGLNRTYPNEFTREGALNYEHDKWNPKGISPDHDLDIAFTRLIAGSTDYHLGGFRAVTPDKFRAQYTRPLVLGTRSHMLAMYVVLENANAMVCDYPEAYEGELGFDFIKEVPVTWDDTKVLMAEPDQYVVIARRKNNNWWIGGITGNTGRTLQIPFDWIENGSWKLKIYQDNVNIPFNPNGILIRSVIINISGRLISNDPVISDVFKIVMAAGGGFTMKLEKQ